MKLSYKHIQHLLVSGKNTLSKWLGYVGLGAGVLLLLISIQLFINIQQLLQEEAPRKDGYDFISISKVITNDNMGKDNRFSDADLQALQRLPMTADISPLLSNQYRVRATAGDIIPFSTDLFLESLDNDFIDTVPPSFTWKPGDLTVPIIFSGDFLELYNVFAPAQGLPQISAKTISSVNIILVCSGNGGMQQFRGNIVALSDRISSILVPKSFMNWSNYTFSGDTTVHASRVYLKTKDANDPKLISFLDDNGYHVNKDKIKFGRVKAVLQNVVGALAIFGILVIVLALLLFSFYLQMVLAKSRDNLRLLLTLGYSPGWLAKSVAQSWLPVYLVIIGAALVFTQVLHLFFVQWSFATEASLSPVLHFSVWLAAVLLIALAVYSNARMVKKELANIHLS